MTLKDLIASDRDAVLLNSDEFAETVTYYPTGGSPRNVVAVVQERGVYTESSDEAKFQRFIAAFVGRDPTNATKGGIDEPRLGDYIKRSDGSKYGFTGDIENIHDSSWWLTFVKNDALRHGLDQKGSR